MPVLSRHRAHSLGAWGQGVGRRAKCRRFRRRMRFAGREAAPTPYDHDEADYYEEREEREENQDYAHADSIGALGRGVPRIYAPAAAVRRTLFEG